MSEKQKKCPECEVGAPAWMNTYGDMVTLLLTFFIALMGTQNPVGQPMKLILSSFEGSLGPLEGGNTLSPGILSEMGATVESLPSTSKGKGLAKHVQKVSDLFKPEIKSQKVRIDETTKGYKITLASDLFFRPATAELNYNEGIDLLRKVAGALKDGSPKTRIEVVGHTDAGHIRPGSALHTKYPSNWELSTARASTVVRYLIDFGLAPERFYAEGRSEYEPLESNNTPEGRAYNRRVEIYVTVDRDRR